MKTLMRIVLALAFLGIASAAVAATPVPGGKWSWVFVDKKGNADRPIRVYTYRPKACDSTCPIWFVMHGMKRNASHYRDMWVDLSDRYKFIVIAPEFSQKDYPKAAWYNLGGVAESENPEKWAYAAIDHIFEEMRDGQADYRIFGHSAGAQFVERMLLLRPQSKASLYAAGNPGWHLLPEWRKDKGVEQTFPYSLIGSKSGEAQAREAFSRRFILLLGENDTDPDDESLEKADGAMKQGANRVERGETFFKVATRVSGEIGAKFDWQLVEVPGVAHDGLGMSNALGVQLYGKR